MKLYENTRPSHGVSYHPWVSRIKELLDDQKLELPPAHELRQYYWDDLSYEEVVHKVEFKTRKNVWMELHVSHGYGKYTTHFNTTDQAKEFFRRFPELRDDLNKL